MTGLSIILVNYKSAGLLADCLRSVYTETRGIEFEILVVDNHSGDRSREMIVQEFPDVRWIQMTYNAGFARANNEGIRRSSGDIILLLNTDTIIEQNGIGVCYCHFRQSEYIACGVQLLNADRSPQISGNYFMKGGLNYLLPLPYLGNFFKALGERMNVKKPHVPDSDATVEVDWINGAFLMVKKEAIQKAGLMDEDFFLYSEEAEWCYRLKQTGRLCIFGDVKVVHLQGETSSKVFESAGKGYNNLYDKKGLQIMVSVFVRLRKQFGVGWFAVNLFFYVLEIPVFFIGLLLAKLFAPGKNAYSFHQLGSYCAHVFAIIKLTPIIISNKPHFYKIL